MMLYTLGSSLRPGAEVSSLKRRMPRVISRRMKKRMNEPATAKECNAGAHHLQDGLTT